MKVVITGSHFSPAYAVIKKSKWNITVVGRKYALSNSQKESYEYKICQQENIPFKVLDVPRFLRVDPAKSLLSSIGLLKSVKRARRILQEINPDIVLSFGGYTSLPVVFAAFLMRKPIIIHEQTLGAGFSNKLAAKFANRVLISFSSSRKHFPKDKTYLTGNPIRSEILDTKETKKVVNTDKKIIYVTGGSTGSMAINDMLEKIINKLSDYYVIHQYGSSKDNTLNNLSNYFSKPHFTPKEVSWIMKNASLIISRSGINTVTEILYLGVPAIFIPLPYGQKNEQLKNAKYAEKHGKAKYLIQEKTTPKDLLNQIRVMIKKGKTKKINESIKRHAKATDLIINEVEKFNKKTKQRKIKK